MTTQETCPRCECPDWEEFPMTGPDPTEAECMACHAVYAIEWDCDGDSEGWYSYWTLSSDVPLRFPPQGWLRSFVAATCGVLTS